MNFADSEYLKQNIATPLALGLSHILKQNTNDKVSALALYLKKYVISQENKERDEKRANEFLNQDKLKQNEIENVINKEKDNKDSKLLDFNEFTKEIKSIPASYAFNDFSSTFINKISYALSSNVYLGQLHHSNEFIEYVASSQAFLSTQYLNKNEGITFDAFNEIQRDGDLVDSEEIKTIISDKVLPKLHVSNVLMDPRTSKLKFFKNRQFGAYICSALKFSSINTNDNIKSLIVGLSDPSLTPETAEEKLHELKALLPSAAEFKYVLCADTIGQNKDFSKEQLSFFDNSCALLLSELKQRSTNDFWKDFELLRKLNLNSLSVLASFNGPSEEDLTKLKTELGHVYVEEADSFLTAKKRFSLVGNLMIDFKKFTAFRGNLSIIESLFLLIGSNHNSFLQERTKEMEWKKFQSKLTRDLLKDVEKINPAAQLVLNEAEITAMLASLSALPVDELRQLNGITVEILKFVISALKYKVAVSQKKAVIAAAAAVPKEELEVVAEVLKESQDVN